MGLTTWTISKACGSSITKLICKKRLTSGNHRNDNVPHSRINQDMWRPKTTSRTSVQDFVSVLLTKWGPSSNVGGDARKTLEKPLQ
jgi:hypothetical protein